MVYGTPVMRNDVDKIQYYRLQVTVIIAVTVLRTTVSNKPGSMGAAIRKVLYACTQL